MYHYWICFIEICSKVLQTLAQILALRLPVVSEVFRGLSHSPMELQEWCHKGAIITPFHIHSHLFLVYHSYLMLCNQSY